MIWFIIYLLSNSNFLLLIYSLWPVVLIIMTDALIAGMIISVIMAIKNKIGDKDNA